MGNRRRLSSLLPLGDLALLQRTPFIVQASDALRASNAHRERSSSAAPLEPVNRARVSSPDTGTLNASAPHQPRYDRQTQPRPGKKISYPSDPPTMPQDDRDALAKVESRTAARLEQIQKQFGKRNAEGRVQGKVSSTKRGALGSRDPDD